MEASERQVFAGSNLKTLETLTIEQTDAGSAWAEAGQLYLGHCRRRHEDTFMSLPSERPVTAAIP